MNYKDLMKGLPKGLVYFVVIVILGVFVERVYISQEPISYLFYGPSTELKAARKKIKELHSEFQNENPFWVSILREDGILFPFAMYKDGNWSNPWPQTVEEKPEKSVISFNDIPKSWLGQSKEMSNWHLWPKSGKPSTTKVTKALLFASHCESYWGLLTDYPSKSYNYSPYPKVGIAINMKQDLKRIINVTHNSSEARNIVTFIKPSFIKHENDEIFKIVQEGKVINGKLKYYGHPISKEERDKVEISIEHLYRNDTDIDGQYIYYFEAKKKYRNPSSTCYTSDGKPVPCNFECDAISLFKGFLLKGEKGKLSLINTKLDITDCDMKEADFAIPLGIMTIKDKNFIILENHYYEAEAYEIMEYKHSGIHTVFITFGGSC